MRDYGGRAQELLERFSLAEHRLKLGSELSKGMAQKLNICLGLFTQPSVLLLDEPFIGLDPHAIKELKLTMERLRDQGATLLVSTHIIDSVDMLWDRAVVMQAGRMRANVARSGLEGQRATLDASNPALPQDFMEYFEAGGLTSLSTVELAVGLTLLGILVVQTVGAQRSVSRLFVQADVNLLFALEGDVRSSLLLVAASVALLVGMALMARDLPVDYYEEVLAHAQQTQMLMSVDFFASASGTFADVSIPSSIGTSLMQVIQVLLLYVGIIFDGAILAYGANTGHVALGFALVTVLDLLFGATFLGLTGVWLYPSRGRVAAGEKGAHAAPPRWARGGALRAYVRVGLLLAAMYVAVFGRQRLLAQALPAHPVLALYLPIYGMGLPVFVLAMGLSRVLGSARSLPGSAGKTGGADRRCPGGYRPLGTQRFLLLIPTCFFVMYTGNVVGLALEGLLGAVLPAMPSWQAGVEPTTGHLALQVAVLAVVAPLMEEFVFRRCVIDRLAPHGEDAAIMASALAFALLHGSLSQACYAFALGLVFGQVYAHTRRLRYTVALHVTINALTTIVLPALLLLAARSSAGADPGSVELAAVLGEPGVLALLAYLGLLFALWLLGSVMFAFGVREHQTVFSPDAVLVYPSIGKNGS